MLWSFRLILGVSLAAVSLAACQAAPTPGPAPASPPRVVATFSVLGDLVQRVAGGRVALTILVGPDSDTHSYEPTPGDTRALADAQVIFANGAGFEPWLAGLVTAARTAPPPILVTDGLALLSAGPDEVDPHVWQSVANVRRIVARIEAALTAADPAHAADYQANAAAYQRELAALDADLAAQIQALPVERRKLVTNHDTFAYLARDYGFVIVGDALGGASTEGSEPSAAEIAALAEAVRAQGVPAVFAENIGQAGVLERIAQEAGVTLGPRLYTDALSAAGGPADTYLALMRYNVAAIVGALR